MKMLISMFFAFLISSETYAADNSSPTVSLKITQGAHEFSPSITKIGTIQKAPFNTSGFARDNAISKQTSAVQQDNVLSGLVIYSLILLVYSAYWYRNSRITE